MSKRGAAIETEAIVLAPTGVINPAPIEVKTPVFVGSLGMLFACVREGSVSLSDIPLAPICTAYCRYLIENRDVNLDEAAVALAALAYLLERKAWGLLPSADPEPEQDEMLVLPMPSVQEYELAIEALREGHEERSRRFFRTVDAEPDLYEIPLPPSEVGIEHLARALEQLLLRADPQPYLLQQQPLPSLAEVMAGMVLKLDFEGKGLEDLLPKRFTRVEAVWCFLALLELMRLGQARARLFNGAVRFARPHQETAKPA